MAVQIDFSAIAAALQRNRNVVEFKSDGSGQFAVSKGGRQIGQGAYQVNSVQSQQSGGLK